VPDSLKQAVPTVDCPGCKVAMRLILLEHSVGDLSSALYKCGKCGTETRREFKAGGAKKSSSKDRGDLSRG
jgi:hypothetical protein